MFFTNLCSRKNPTKFKIYFISLHHIYVNNKSETQSIVLEIPTTEEEIRDSALEHTHKAINLIITFTISMFILQECNKTFKRISTLKEHIQTHAKGLDGKKAGPHGCPYCNKTFQKPSQIERHIRIHTGELSMCTFKFKGDNYLFRTGYPL